MGALRGGLNTRLRDGSLSGRNQITDFRDWVRLDLEYIDNWTIWLDLKILFLTIPVVLRGTGAK